MDPGLTGHLTPGEASGPEPAAISVVIVEDRPADGELMVFALEEEGYQPATRVVATLPDFVTSLDDPPDLILSDWHLPQFNALDALAVARERLPDVPFVTVSGTIGETVAVEALHRGADDYVLKDRLARLGPAVRRAMEMSRVRLLQRRVALQRDRLAQAIAQTHDMVVITDREGTVQYVNAAFERVTGYSSAEAVGQNPRILNSGLQPLSF